jgi:hypothetical protein
MTLAEKIQRYVQRLPVSFQAEVLDFVEFLLSKSERDDDADWTEMSLAAAMRGMEDEETPLYTQADLRVTFA